MPGAGSCPSVRTPERCAQLCTQRSLELRAQAFEAKPRSHARYVDKLPPFAVEPLAEMENMTGGRFPTKPTGEDEEIVIIILVIIRMNQQMEDWHAQKTKRPRHA